MDLWKRIAIGYGMASVFFPLAAESIKQNGGAYPDNPTWVLISTIRNILIASWIVGILGFLIRHWVIESEKAEQEWQRKESARKEAERAATEEAQHNQRQISRKFDELEKQMRNLSQELVKVQRSLADSDEPKKQGAAQPLQFQSDEDSIQLALEDFG